MKKLLIIMMVVLLAAPVMAKEVKLRFEWSPNSEADMAGYALFIRQEGQVYDYSQPIDPSCTLAEDGFCYVDPIAKTCEFEYTFTAPDGQITTFYFVARAHDMYTNWSDDSNEVSQTFDLAPIVAPSMLIGVYNDALKTIDFVWEQNNVDRVVRWRLYMKQGTNDFTEVGELIKTPEMISPYAISWDVPGDGNYIFTVVAFTEEWISSINSNEATVQVKVHPSPVHNFKVKIRIK